MDLGTLTKSFLERLKPEALPIKSITLFGMAARPEYDPEWDDVQFLIVATSDQDMELVSEKLAAALNKVDDDYGIYGLPLVRSSTRGLVIAFDELAQPEAWAARGFRPEYARQIQVHSAVLFGEDIRSALTQPTLDQVEQSAGQIRIPFPLTDVVELQRRDPALAAFLNELVLGFRCRSEDYSSIGGISQFVQQRYHIHRAELEECLRIEIDAYLKRSRSRHIYFQSSDPFEGKTWFLSFGVSRCRERGIPIRYFSDFDWQGLNAEEQLEMLNRRINSLKSRRWAVCILDEVQDIIHLKQALKMIDDAGFMTLAAGCLGKIHFPKLPNLTRMRFADDPFRASQLIGHMRARMQFIDVKPLDSPLLADIARATLNPFTASAMIGGILTEQRWRQVQEQEIPVEDVVNSWVQRAHTREFMEWCQFVADPDLGLVRREAFLARQALLLQQS